MTQPKVTINELDGQMGILPPSAGRLLAMVGPSTGGTANVPTTLAKVSDVVSAFTSGPLVEAGAHAIERWGRPVLFVKTGRTTAGAAGSVGVTGVAGTSVITADGSSEPLDDFDVVFKVVAGGTIGTTGITFRYSLDGGANYSALTALGTANTYTIPGSGVKLNFAAGTLVAGDVATVRTSAPCWNTSELGTALDALAASVVQWEICEIVGPIDANAFDTIETKFAAMAAAGKFRSWIGNTRMPNAAESEATYLSSLTGVFSVKSSVRGMLCAGACDLTSSVSGRKYRRPVAHAVAARESSLSEEQNSANLNLGTLVGVSIRDANGNVKHHDESANPGLDDARFTVLRTVDGIPGVYVNRPRVFSTELSDFQLLPHRRVMDLAHAALRVYFMRRLNKPILVNPTTGYILESEAREIENGALKAMEAVLLAKPKASGCTFALSRTDNLLSTKTLNGQARVIPLAYPEFITVDVGFTNPALQVTTNV